MSPIILRNGGAGIALACNQSSGGTRVPLVGDGDSLVVTNIGYFDAFLAIGGLADFSAVAPGSTGSYVILARSKEDQLVLSVDEPHSHVAAVCRSGESTILLVHLVQR